MAIIDNDNPSNPFNSSNSSSLSNSSNHSNSADTKNNTESIQPMESANPTDAIDATDAIDTSSSVSSTEYTLESDLDDLDYADVEYYDVKQLKKDIRATNTIMGCKLKEVRLSARFTRQELAIILGVSEERIERYENGEQGITLAELFKVCKELGADVWYFFMGG